jgi:hypothetical protein
LIVWETIRAIPTDQSELNRLVGSVLIAWEKSRRGQIGGKAEIFFD